MPDRYFLKLAAVAAFLACAGLWLEAPRVPAAADRAGGPLEALRQGTLTLDDAVWREERYAPLFQALEKALRQQGGRMVVSPEQFERLKAGRFAPKAADRAPAGRALARIEKLHNAGLIGLGKAPREWAATEGTAADLLDALAPLIPLDTLKRAYGGADDYNFGT